MALLRAGQRQSSFFCACSLLMSKRTRKEDSPRFRRAGSTNQGLLAPNPKEVVEVENAEPLHSAHFSLLRFEPPRFTASAEQFQAASRTLPSKCRERLTPGFDSSKLSAARSEKMRFERRLAFFRFSFLQVYQGNLAQRSCSNPARNRWWFFWFSFGTQKRTQLNGRALSPCKKPSKRVS